jgi:hypothetical protein
MGRNQRQRRRYGAFWLLLLALVSVVAPVQAQTYLCPMAKEALEQVASCCSKVPQVHQAIPGSPRLEPPCDCPELSWNASPGDQARELRVLDRTVALSAVVARTATSLATKSVSTHAPPRAPPPRLAPPLWRLNQAILC